MTTSGTANFFPDLVDILTESFERCGLQLRAGYDYRTGRRSLDILMQEWSNRGMNLWTVQSGTQALTQGTATYTLPADTIDIVDHVLRTGSGDINLQQDLYMNRISVSTYAQIPNKLTQGRPLQIYVDRQAATPQFTTWPVADGSQPYVVAYWRLVKIQDSGQPGTNTMNVPTRFIPPLVAGLAYYIAMKRVSDLNRVAGLKAIYQEQWDLAAGEDRDRSSVRFVPFMGYTTGGV